MVSKRLRLNLWLPLCEVAGVVVPAIGQRPEAHFFGHDRSIGKLADMPNGHAKQRNGTPESLAASARAAKAWDAKA